MNISTYFYKSVQGNKSFISLVPEGVSVHEADLSVDRLMTQQVFLRRNHVLGSVVIKPFTLSLRLWKVFAIGKFICCQSNLLVRLYPTSVEYLLVPYSRGRHVACSQVSH